MKIKSWLRWAVVGMLCFVMIGGAVFTGTIQKINPLPNYPTRQVKIGAEVFTILLPKKGPETRLGLGVVEKLPANYGMLFPGTGTIGMWMKGMNYSIDIIWLDEKGKIIHIVQSAQPSSYPKTTFRNPVGTQAASVIEIGSGEVKRLNVREGDAVQFL